MIDLNIFQFGGRGGSSGRGGSAGGPGGGAYASPETESNKSFKEGRIKGNNNIRSAETYTLYEVKDKNDSNEKEYTSYKGSTIRDRIAHDIFNYDSRQQVWIDKETGKVYVIRLKRTR